MTNQTELLRRSAKNDQLAFKQLYEETSPKLYSLVLRIMSTKSVAEEVLQESYLKIWRKADSYDPTKGSVIGWMTVITRNTAFDTLRALSSRPQETETSYEGSQFVSVEHSPEVSSDQTSKLQTLEQQLQMLRPEQRESIIYSYYYGYSHRELSEMTGKPLGTIKAWIRRGSQQLLSHYSPNASL